MLASAAAFAVDEHVFAYQMRDCLPQLAALMEEKKRAYDDGHALAHNGKQADPSLYFEKAADLDFQVRFC